jgi:hypothetical protein
MARNKRGTWRTDERVWYEEDVESFLAQPNVSMCAGKNYPYYEFTTKMWIPYERTWQLNRERREGLVYAEKPQVFLRVNDVEKYCRHGTILQVKAFKEENFDLRMVWNAAVAIKLHEGWAIHARDVIRTTNQTLRFRALKAMGTDKFLEKAKMEKVHADKHGVLYRARGTDLQFVRVIDPSTGNTYMLQVPPDVVRAKQGVAWGFGMSEEQYEPLVET